VTARRESGKRENRETGSGRGATGLIRVGVSACLLGNTVRYDGRHKLERFLCAALGSFVAWVPVCPEVDYGLPVPREALQLTGDPADPRLVACSSGLDHTAGLKAWAARRLDELERDDLCGFIFKSRSPSCGLRGVPVVGRGGAVSPATGVGIFARAFTERFPLLPVEEEQNLGDPRLLEHFIGRLLESVRGPG
jgi:uncharacterized protein YbbK (DUF523 family)